MHTFLALRVRQTHSIRGQITHCEIFIYIQSFNHRSHIRIVVSMEGHRGIGNNKECYQYRAMNPRLAAKVQIYYRFTTICVIPWLINIFCMATCGKILLAFLKPQAKRMGGGFLVYVKYKHGDYK